MIYMNDGDSVEFELSSDGVNYRADLQCTGETVYLTIEAFDGHGGHDVHTSTFKDADEFQYALLSALVAEWNAAGRPRGEAP